MKTVPYWNFRQVDLGNMCNKIIQLLDGLVKNALSGKHLPQLRYSLDPNLAKEDAIMRNKQKKNGTCDTPGDYANGVVIIAW